VCRAEVDAVEVACRFQGARSLSIGVHLLVDDQRIDDGFRCVERSDTVANRVVVQQGKVIGRVVGDDGCAFGEQFAKSLNDLGNHLGGGTALCTGAFRRKPMNIGCGLGDFDTRVCYPRPRLDEIAVRVKDADECGHNPALSHVQSSSFEVEDPQSFPCAHGFSLRAGWSLNPEATGSAFYTESVTVPNPYSSELKPRVGIEHVLQVDNTTTHWWEYSSTKRAKTLVFVHGFRGDHHGLQLFADALPEYRILIPDIPVFGLSSTWPTGLSSIDDYGRWLRAFLAATQNVDSAVLGHSFGSVVVANALRGARKTPIILVNPISQLALTGPKRVAAALASLWYSVGRMLPERPGSAWLGNPLFVRAMSEMLTKSRNPSLRRWIHEQHARYFSSYSDRDSLVSAFTVSTSATVADYASQIDAPVLLVAADQDDITPVSAQRAIQREFPNAKLHVLENVGHLVHYEKPIETAAAIRTFLARHQR